MTADVPDMAEQRLAPPVQPEWGRRIQLKREELGWSIRQAARAAGMSDPWWGQVEKGWRRVRDKAGRITYVTVHPSSGSFLVAARALRMTDAETDELLAAAGHAQRWRSATTAPNEPGDVVAAILSDDLLTAEQKLAMIEMYRRSVAGRANARR